MLWDIFCKVIDNHGDAGVCWRLACDLATRGESVRLRIDDASALAWMAPGGQVGVTVPGWNDTAPPGDVVVEAFACELPDAFQAAIAEATRQRGSQPAWINLEYLTAESFAERSHGLPSPVMAGPARGCTKRFFFPGFTARTGGLIREPALAERQSHFDAAAWLHVQGIPTGDEQRISLFCYEPALLGEWLDRLAAGRRRTRVLVTAGRAAQAVRATGRGESGALALTFLPLLPQPEYDHLLWSCDINFVRGEDSLVRAIWAGRPFVWQLYPQEDGAHEAKLEAFLAWLQPPDDVARFFRAWNGTDDADGPGKAAFPADLAAWRASVHAGRHSLAAREDLTSGLLRLAATEKG